MIDDSFEFDIKYVLTMLIDECDHIASMTLNREAPIARLISGISSTGEHIYRLEWKFTNPEEHKKFINRLLTGVDERNV